MGNIHTDNMQAEVPQAEPWIPRSIPVHSAQIIVQIIAPHFGVYGQPVPSRSLSKVYQYSLCNTSGESLAPKWSLFKQRDR